VCLDEDARLLAASWRAACTQAPTGTPSTPARFQEVLHQGCLGVCRGCLEASQVPWAWVPGTLGQEPQCP